MAGTSVTFDDSKFLKGLGEAFVEFRADSRSLVDAIGEKVADRGRELAPVLSEATGAATPGELRDSITSEAGEDPNGHFVVVGSRGVRWAIPQEYGTYKMAPHPFMRPALAEIARDLKIEGLSASLRGRKRALENKRTGLRAKVRKAYQSGKITSGEARGLSKLISSEYRYRPSRKRG